MPDATTLEFLNTVYPWPFADLAPRGAAEAPQLVIWTLDRRGRSSRSVWTESIEQAAAAALRQREDRHVFFGVALQDQAAALARARRHRPGAGLESVRGWAGSAAALPAIWGDLDVAGPTHKRDTLPPDRASTLGLLEAVPQPASCLVATGGGVHGSGPYPCLKIARLGAAEDHCRHCPHRGHVKGPLVLGRTLPLTPPAPLSLPPITPTRERGGPPPPTIPPHSPPADGGDGDDRVPIYLSTREREVADQALAVLAERQANLFRRGGALVQVVAEDGGERPPHRPPAPPAARQVSEPRMRELLASHCRFLKARNGKDAIEWRPAHPPQWASRALVSRHRWPALPRLEGLVEGPVLRADGTVLQTPGYDTASGLYLVPTADCELPTPVQLGRKLRSLRGRVIGGRRAVPLERTRRGVVWAVEAAAGAS